MKKTEQTAKTRFTAGLASLLALATLALCSSPAHANSAHAYSGLAFGGPGSSAGQLSLVQTRQEAPASGVAVNDATHDVYVADTGNNRIDEFSSAGVFVRAWGWGVADGLSNELQSCTIACFKGIGTAASELEKPVFIAVDNSPGGGGDVYVTGPGHEAESPENLVLKFSAEGKLVESWGSKGRLDGSSATEGPFGAPAGVTVDVQGNLWVYVGGTRHSLNDHMYEFGQAGSFITSWVSNFGGYSPYGLAVDASDDLYISENDQQLKLSPAGSYLRTVSEVSTSGLAVDTGAGQLYAGSGSAIEQFATSCEPGTKGCTLEDTFGAAQLTAGAGVAVDSSSKTLESSTVYAADAATNQVYAFTIALEANTGPATQLTANTATLTGTVNPKGSLLGECEFEYGPDSEYGQSVPCEESVAAIGEGIEPVEVHAKVTGLHGATAYHSRLVAKKGSTTVPGEDQALETSPVAIIAGETAANVTSSSADLQATVNPDGLQVTSCVFEYGTSTSYGLTATCEQKKAQIGAGSQPVLVSAAVGGLQPNTTYHWRLSARDANDTSRGSDHTFVYDTTGAGLPDGRAYEMVTPPQKNGAVIGGVLFGFPPVVSSDGSRVIATSVQCFAGSESCTADRQEEGEPFEFSRTPAGWLTTALAPPASFRVNTEWGASADAGFALFSMPTPPGGEDDWYVRRADGSLVDIGPTTPPGTTGISSFESLGRSYSADLSHIVWESESSKYFKTFWPFESPTVGHSVYEYFGTGNTQPFLVGVSGGPGSTDLIGTCGVTGLGSLSADGRTVIFTVNPCGGGSGENAGIPVPAYELYARVDGELPDAHTIGISRPQCEDVECVAAEAHPGDAEFKGASTDASKVFFFDGQQLTDNASQTGDAHAAQHCSFVPSGTSGCNLYEYDSREPAGHRLIDVSATALGRTGGPAVQGVMAMSADGSHVYFVADSVLASGATPGHCRPGSQAGKCNLYVYERDAHYPAGHLAFVASLPASESHNWKASFANVTPDGRFLVFESHGDLTSDDTRSDGAMQIFRYDSATGVLARVSVGNDGFNDNGNAGVGDASIGAPTMSGDGAYVFFQSPIGLTPRALNDVQIEGGGKQEYAQNLYEYHEGHVYLISDGRDVSAAKSSCHTRVSAVCLLGVDATGSNVFFTTSDQLVSSDTDTGLDIYDARICTVSSPCIKAAPPALPPCLGEACHGIPAATPALLAPGSVTFDGQGNIAQASSGATVKAAPKALTRAQKLARALHACKADRSRRKRAACEASARRRYGKAGKSSARAKKGRN